eukprot:TRINITY_DN14497_c0_g1_i1.p1 TRINITY_DN14497_c0_g1~~TRINITY_DN14497_c0_g1_i1.p1  ORF type:complete len:551 (+),score=258.13 TRINITY_DN14497_c0_g1_i1:235-1653(+)
MEEGKSLDEMVLKLQESKRNQEKEAEETGRRAKEAEIARQEAEKRLAAEKVAADRAEKEKAEADARAERERQAAAAAAQRKIEAEQAAARAAEMERKAAEAAAKAAAEERAATEAAVKKAQEELERLKKEAEQAEKDRVEAEKKAAAEKAEAERKETLRIAAREREEETKRMAAKIEAEKKQADRKAKMLEEQKRKEEEEAEEELKEETIKVKLNAADEPLGLDCLAGAGRVRIIEVSGACQRAGVKSASLLMKVDGNVVDSQETLIESVKALRAAKKTEFEIVVLPPLMMSEEDKLILQQYNEQKEEIEQWLKLVDDCEMVKIEMRVVQALGLSDKGSTKPFCEVKLREVKGDKVGNDHANPQKAVTKVVTVESSGKGGKLKPAVWQEDFQFDVPKGDCIRVSIFGNKRLSKEHLGKVDLIMPELLEELCVGPIIARWPLQSKEGKPIEGELELALNLATCDGKIPEQPKK